ncbi:MAG: M61 family metallopeptidase [Pyrinomonadaceae bacterium]
MTKLNKFHCRKIILLLALLAIQVSFALAQNSIRLNVDASDAWRGVLHNTETMTVNAGKFTLFYPKWIPGEHSPTGPLNDMVNLSITANGKPVAWQRDDVEMFAFHLQIPAGANQIEISFDDVSQPRTTMSANLARIKWNRLLLYPEGAKSDNVQVTASLKMPADWKYATALPVANEAANLVNFKPATLTYFVDSPAVIGKFFKRVPLGTIGGAPHEIDIFADSAAALEYKPETLAGWNNLVKEANLAFGAHHYNSYRFLLTLSDYGGSEGLEHHESSEDGVGEDALSTEAGLYELGDLLGHEYTHSWNGKYRRPIGLATGDYETPMKGELLWVYEGLTQYLGHVFPSRSGLWTPENFRDTVASDAASLDYQSGRNWRPVVDTARAVQFTYSSPRVWLNERRRVEYYDEGALIWLEADVLIRQKSGGTRSLNDFFKKFHGGQNTAPKVVPYDFEEVVRTLNEVEPYDWRGFLTTRIYNIQKNAPMGGITNGGWQLVYNDTPNPVSRGGSFAYSLGLYIAANGVIADVNPNLAGYKAGLAPAMQITKINGAPFSVDSLRAAVAATKDSAGTITVEANNAGTIGTYTINYQGGLRFPHLVRDESKPDILSEIIKPL